MLKVSDSFHCGHFDLRAVVIEQLDIVGYYALNVDRREKFALLTEHRCVYQRDYHRGICFYVRLRRKRMLNAVLDMEHNFIFIDINDDIGDFFH